MPEYPERYEDDLLFFFGERRRELTVYRALTAAMERALPPWSLRVQKTQISFYNRHLFAAASVPVRRKKDWPRECLMVTVGLSAPLSSPRVAVATEPYPGRWTHHLLLTEPGQVDGELLGWLLAAYDFAQSK